MLTKVNVAECETQLLWERGKFDAATFDLTEALGGRVIGASVWETKAGSTQGPYHFHDGVEEWMYVVSGEPVLRDPTGERLLKPGTLAAFQAGPSGAHTFDGPGRVVMFSVGTRGWGEAFTSVYPDADKIGGKPGIQFRRAAALDTWAEPPASVVPPAPAGPCPQVDLRSLPADGSNLAKFLHTQTWAATLYELGPGETTGRYHYDWCREHWALVLDGAPTLRHPGGQDVMSPGDVVCFPEGETGAHQLLNHADDPARLLICSAPSLDHGPRCTPTTTRTCFAFPGRLGTAFDSRTSLATTGTACRAPAAPREPRRSRHKLGPAVAARCAHESPTHARGGASSNSAADRTLPLEPELARRRDPCFGSATASRSIRGEPPPCAELVTHRENAPDLHAADRVGKGIANRNLR